MALIFLYEKALCVLMFLHDGMPSIQNKCGPSLLHNQSRNHLRVNNAVVISSAPYKLCTQTRPESVQVFRPRVRRFTHFSIYSKWFIYFPMLPFFRCEFLTWFIAFVIILFTRLTKSCFIAKIKSNTFTQKTGSERQGECVGQNISVVRYKPGNPDGYWWYLVISTLPLKHTRSIIHHQV